MHATFQSKLRKHEGHLVEVKRRPKGACRIEGFVVGCSEEVILFHRLDWDTFTLNGYLGILNKDVSAYRFFDKKDYWDFRAAAHFKLAPKIPEGIRVSSLRDLISSAGEHYPLLRVHRERIDPDVCFIGRLGSMSSATFSIDDLNSSAEWTGPRRIRFQDVTRIDFDGGYQRALAVVAPPPSKAAKIKSTPSLNPQLQSPSTLRLQ